MALSPQDRLLHGPQRAQIRAFPKVTPHNPRLAIDLGIPVVNVQTLLHRISQEAGKSEDYNHEFYLRVKAMVDARDSDGITKEKIV